MSIHALHHVKKFCLAPFKNKDHKKVPVLKGTLFLGRFKYMLAKNGPLQNMTEVVNFLLKKEATAGMFRAGPQKVLVMLDPEEAKSILNMTHDSINRHAAFKAIGAILGENIFSCEINKWPAHREVSKEAFSKQTITTQYLSPAEQVIKQQLQALHQGQNDLTKWVTLLMMQLTCVTLLGISVSRLKKIESEIERLTYLLQNVFHFKKIIVFGMPKIVSQLFFKKDQLDTKKIKKEFHQIIYSIYEKAPEMRQSPNNFLKTGEALLSEEALIGDMLAFLFAGPDSSISTFLSVIRLLDANPFIAQQLIEEVQLHGKDPSYLQGEKNLLAKVIKEALRLYAPFIFLTRGISSPTMYRNQTLSKNTLLFVPLYHLQRLPSVWGEDALEFKPNRFDQITKEQQLHYMPFGYGAQNCIAKGFALQMIKQLIVQMILTVGLPQIKNNDATPENRAKNLDVSIESGGALKPANSIFGEFVGIPARNPFSSLDAWPEPGVASLSMEKIP